ncbi:hypothetical protein FPANT_7543 [Fusarium pseudoanthophilum]|uniref:Uncharacterized protein n=1 Tax=Fusarium pseudoanthophilum TaxID=48495 RepID=A0A8H5L7A7_9HYPO|nr:hypothetical protein FPANT_7543 [Fusarium pseudoanthophilum]
MEPADQVPSSSDVPYLPEALADLKRKADAGEARQIEATSRRFDYDLRKSLITIRKPGIVHEAYSRVRILPVLN